MKDLIAKVEKMTADTRRFLAERAARQIPARTNAMVESVLKVSRAVRDAQPDQESARNGALSNGGGL